MSWNIAKRVAKKKANKALDFFKKKKERVDKDVPLRLRIGAAVSINPTAFLLAGEDLYAENPGKDNVITAIGIIDYNDFKIYRAYMVKDEEECCLQVIYDPSNDSIEQVTIFSTVDEIYPQDNEEWDEWLDEKEGHIGMEVFNTPDDVEFDRVWAEGPEKVHAETFTETIYTDPYGEEGIQVDHQAMLYSRTVENDFIEELFLSAEEEDEGAHVRIACGLVIDYEAVEVV